MNSTLDAWLVSCRTKRHRKINTNISAQNKKFVQCIRLSVRFLTPVEVYFLAQAFDVPYCGSLHMYLCQQLPMRTSFGVPIQAQTVALRYNLPSILPSPFGIERFHVKQGFLEVLRLCDKVEAFVSVKNDGSEWFFRSAWKFDITPYAVPHNVKIVRFGKNSKATLHKDCFPSSLRKLVLSGHLTEVRQGALPETLQHLILDNWYGKTFITTFPTRLKILHVNAFQPGQYSLDYPRSLLGMRLPDTLEELALPKDFNAVIPEGWLPPRLRKLVIRCFFMAPIQRNAIPLSVKLIELEGNEMHLQSVIRPLTGFWNQEWFFPTVGGFTKLKLTPYEVPPGPRITGVLTIN